MKNPEQSTVFAPDFVWGAAAAAYQIEGAWDEDGKGPSVWDMYARRPGKINRSENGDVACDHYHRYQEDVGVMQAIGLQAYRLSVSWPRVLPEGVGAVNAKGLDFYDRLIDALLAAGVQPWVTLFHWDFPLALYQKGGWLNRDSVEWFGEYAGAVVRALGDRVKHWITLNEPAVFIELGHISGRHAPGDQLEFGQALLASHHVLMAHGRAVQAIRAHTPQPALVGFAPNARSKVPFTDSPEDIAAAREATFRPDPNSVWSISHWNDPVFLGKYFDSAPEIYGAAWPRVKSEDLQLIAQPLDFRGLNCYSSEFIRAGADGQPKMVPHPTGNPGGTLDWLRVVPDSLYWGARFQAERYGAVPLVITENGLCNLDWVALDGRVHDPQRVDFMQRYLLGLRRAIEEGVSVAGYFYWSVMDNFEWQEGYQPRFGLVHVDYESQKRTLKDSALWYRRVIETNGASLREVPAFRD